ncbi:hypothetical protein HMPREF0762_00036 [Slackia exigua ATCC 700122]|uniref:Uncharacterized protein n=2 Tax=Slackia TaxID=84108 RepID=D0WE13_SLAES|nr:hypothetical protein HMPREF0762_00036 [Slackia exigua ATCC 700122]
MESSCPCIDGAVHENSALAENRGIHHPRAEESFAHAEREPIETLGS